MSGPALKAAEQMVQISSLPASMNGSTLLYSTTLTAVMCGAVLGAWVVLWMARDTFRDRAVVKYKSVLFNFRLMMGLAGMAAFVACVPEVFYLQMYGAPDVSKEVQAVVMTGKRVADSSRIFLIIGWTSVLIMIYPYLCLALMDIDLESEQKQAMRYLQVADYPAIRRLIRPMLVFLLLALSAMVFAFSKVYHL